LSTFRLLTILVSNNTAEEGEKGDKEGGGGGGRIKGERKEGMID
jgi:hypothetical protein